MRVGVAGAGLVGAVVARLLAEAGYQVLVVDRGPQPTGASTVPRAAMHPFTGIRPRWDADEQAAWRHAWSFYLDRAPQAFRGSMWLLRLPPNERTAAIWKSRFEELPPGAAGVVSWLQSEDCHELQAGLSEYAACWGGLLVHEVPFIDVVALCSALLEHPGVNRLFGSCWWDEARGVVVEGASGSDAMADAWVLATGAAQLPGLTLESPLAPMGGEVLVVELAGSGAGLRLPRSVSIPAGVIGYRSHITPLGAGRLMLSATYDELGRGTVSDGTGRGWLGLLARLAEVMPALAGQVEVVGAWSGVRPTPAGVRDGGGARVVPVAESVVWATGTGSRGLLESPALAAEVLRWLGAKTTKPPAGAQ